MTADRIDAFLDLLGSAMRAGSPEASYRRMREVAETFARESASSALTELAVELDERAASYRRNPDATEQMARHARAAIVAAAEMARQRARGHAGETDGHALASLPGQDGSEAQRGPGSRVDEIKFASDLIPLILSGSKTLTYRLDGKFDSVQVGDVLRVTDAGTGEARGRIAVTGARKTRVGELDPADPRHESYQDLRHLRRCLAVYYGRPVGTIEPVTVLEFRVTEGGAS